jgi:hypothetical protein
MALSGLYSAFMRVWLTETAGDVDAVCEGAYSQVSSWWMHLSQDGRPSSHWPRQDKVSTENYKYGRTMYKSFHEEQNKRK